MEKIVNIKSKKYKISSKIYLPDKNVELKEMIIACHGFAGDKESSAIKLLAEEMIKNKVGVICFDFPGHGESETNATNLTIDNCIQDINIIEDYIKQNYKNIPISIFSTSFGAYLTLINIAQNNRSYKNIILRSPAIKMANVYRHTLLRENENDYKNRGYTKLGFERELIIPYKFMEELDSNDIFEMYKDIEPPQIYIIQGDQDDIAPIEDTREFVDMNCKNIKLYIIEGAEHRMKGEGELEKAIEYSKEIILKNK